MLTFSWMKRKFTGLSRKPFTNIIGTVAFFS